jgi:hypothetical protein
MFFVVTPLEYLSNIKDSCIPVHENYVVGLKLLHVHVCHSRVLQRAQNVLL